MNEWEKEERTKVKKKLRSKYLRMARRERIKEKLSDIVNLRTQRLIEIFVKSRVKRDDFESYAIEHWGLSENQSPSDLKIIDNIIHTNLQDFIIKEALRDGKEIQVTEDMRWTGYIILGIYLGDVICKNIGGKWKLPGMFSYFISRICECPSLFYDRWYVIVHKKKIPVIKVVSYRFDGSGRVKSLYEVYEKIRKTGDWK